MEFITTLQEEWPVISQAPFSIAIISFAFLSLGFFIKSILSRSSISSKSAKIELLEAQLAYKPQEELPKIYKVEELPSAKDNAGLQLISEYGAVFSNGRDWRRTRDNGLI